MEILGDYRDYTMRAAKLLRHSGIGHREVVQCDTLCYECSTNERYEDVKKALVQSATLLTEMEVNGRMVSILEVNPMLQAGDWNIPYIELLQPKTTRENIDGIDCVFFVTAYPVRRFPDRYPDIKFEKKGLSNKLNPYIELKGDDVAFKLHDRHFGAVADLEQTLES